MHMTNLANHRQRGVSLIEVLISLLIVAIGVLGISKMQALVIANSQVSGARGLIALQASSLGALMHGNKGYWQVPIGTTPYCAAASCSLKGSSTTSFGSVPSACSFTSLCSASQIAAWDINNWMAQMNANVPGYTTTINCSNSATLPVTCAIEITWLEKQAGADAATASNAAAHQTVTQAFYLYVQP